MMTRKVSLRDLAVTVDEFENTVRSELGHSASSGEVLNAINKIKAALNEIRTKGDASDQIFCISDQIICGNKNANG